MCGIAGLAVPSDSGRIVDASILDRMRDVITHRGPDACGSFIEGGIGLAHRRLSIVDLSTGHQPMHSADGNLHVVFNGEIYNHAEYRERLAAKGRSFRTQSDTEIILHLYDEYGDQCVDHLRGMFTFALWDGRRRRLLLARDRLGIKPLYYATKSDGSLVFGSEIKSLLHSGQLDVRVNHNALPDYLANQAPSGEETLFANVKRLPAGHTLVWDNGNIEVSQYWDLDLSPPEQEFEGSDAEYVQSWGEAFRDAVDSHLMSDVPLGVLLSGGIDSTSIAAVMGQLLPRQFKSFSVAFSDKQANELAYAREAAAAFGTDHHDVIVTPEEYFELLPRMTWHEDEPLAHVASIPLYVVCRLASEHVKVVLTGEGADELMAGYLKYRKTVYNLRYGATYQSVIPTGLQNVIRKSLSAIGGRKLHSKFQRTFLYRDANVNDLYFDNFSIFPKAEQESLFHPDLIREIEPLQPSRHQLAHYGKFDDLEVLNRLLYVDSKTYLQELLMKQDQMSMAASIESRVPFLDRDLVELTARLPLRMKLRGIRTKHVLREAMKGQIPDSILKRPKMGFPVPVSRWFRHDYRALIDEFVGSERARERRIFSNEALDKVIDDHCAGTRDNGMRLWSLLNLEFWQRQCVDGDGIDATTESVRKCLRDAGKAEAREAA